MRYQYHLFVHDAPWPIRPKFPVDPDKLTDESLDILTLMAAGTLYFHDYTQMAFTLRDEYGRFVLACDKHGSRVWESDLI
jgi:hypothetical protein